MENLTQLLRSDLFIIGLVLINLLLLVLFFINTWSTKKTRKTYEEFMKKLGTNTNIEQDLKNYIAKVETVEEKNEQIIKYCNKLSENISECTHKIGMVRYNAFRDTGSNLSFAVALLNEYDTGIVLNGIYSREVSNIYAKPVIKGESSYTLSEEEKEAIQIAKNSDGTNIVKEK